MRRSSFRRPVITITHVALRAPRPLPELRTVANRASDDPGDLLVTLACVASVLALLVLVAVGYVQ